MKLKNIVGAVALSSIAFCGSAGAASIYATYAGSQNGVTVRDGTTLVQSNFFDPGFVISGLGAGINNDMYLTSGNSLYHYSDAGVQLNSFTFPDAGISYQGIDLAIGGSNIYTAYTGSQNGVTIRDATTLAQSFSFDPGFAVDRLAAGISNDMYLTSANSIYRYSDGGVQLNSLVFPDPGIIYSDIDFVVGSSEIYTIYSGSQSGVTIRDATTLAQSSFFDPGFIIDGIAAGAYDDMYLTSGNTIYRYTSGGTLLNSFTFPDANLSYGSIDFAVPEPTTTALLALGLLGAGFARKRRIQ